MNQLSKAFGHFLVIMLGHRYNCRSALQLYPKVIQARMAVESVPFNALMKSVYRSHSNECSQHNGFYQTGLILKAFNVQILFAGRNLMYKLHR